MGRHSPPYRSPPRRGYGGRGRTPPRRGYGGRRGQSSGSLLVRNIPLSCRPDDLRVPFERFGPVRDVYLPRDYYSKEPRGFAFVEFVDPYDASEAQYHMDHQVFFGREITVVVAAETRKKPDDMRNRARVRGYSGEHEGRHSRYGRSRSRSRSYSPRYRGRPRSRSYSPATRRQEGYSASPPRSHHTQSPRRQPKGHEDDKRAGRGGGQRDGKRSPPPGSDGSPSRRRSPRQSSESPAGSRSRSPHASPARSD
ncbi:unnamed protein product [Alopecurus aequalis]